MIQRIQSLWLLLASACAFLTVKFSFYSGTDINNVPYQKLNGTTGGFLILVLTILVALLAAITIFLYKNRPLQFRLCLAGVLAELLLVSLYYLKIRHFAQGTLSLTCLLHPAILLFFFLAAKGISQDEKLVKDSDRLR